MHYFYRLSLTSFGYQDEIVEFLHYEKRHRVRVRFLRDGLIEDVSLHLLFPLSAEEHAALAEQSAPLHASQQLELLV
ncbi:MAG: hypothetical protein R3A44_31045 [Caldilineaceae bacterium]